VRARTLWRLVRDGSLGVLLGVGWLQVPFYRLAFLAAALRAGMLARLAGGPVPFERLAEELTVGPAGHDGLRAWLDVGVRTGVLAVDPRGYRVRSRLARRLADPVHDPAAALLEETATLHHALLVETPDRLRSGRFLRLTEQQGELTARSSRTLEAVVREVVETEIASRGPIRLLEIGCGTGIHLAHAARHNAELTGLGLELQEEVAELARRNLAAWGLAGRIAIEHGDVRLRAPEPVFDVATLHNNVYYFPVDERVHVLAHVRGFLRPGGRLLVTSGCAGGSPAMELLGLWAAMTAGCGRLPTPEELAHQLAAAGFASVRARSLVPRDRYFVFVGEV
jgi:SAM-dependent methyltransferase